MTSIKHLVVMLVLGIGMTSAATTTPASTACQQTWVLTSGVNVAGGTVVPAASTVAACQAACIASATCQSIDFTAGAAAGQQCWLATTQTTTGTFVGNAHYDLTRAATSCSSTCAQTWSLTSGVNVAGGTVNAASTVSACQAACIASTTCQSIDFTAGAAAGQQCWLVTSQGPTTAFTGNAHYDLTRAAASCAAATTAPAAATITGPSTASGCQNVWLLTANVNVAGGTANVASTLAACQAACLASPTCVSIDFTAGAVAGQQCWLATITWPTFSFTGNNHYDLTRSAASCTCSQNWVLTNGVNVNGGTVNAATTLAACQAACIASSTCLSIDFTAGAAAGQQCWLGTAQTPTTAFAGNAHYDLARASICPAVTTTPPSGGGGGSATTSPTPATNCQIVWLLTPNVNVAGGTANAATTLAACQSACLASTTCQSIDFTAGAAAGQQCWLATITSPTGPFTGNNHYDLTTRPAASCTPACSLSWVQTNNVNVPGGTVNAATTLAACQAACFASSTCQSIDFTPAASAGQQCWLGTATGPTTAYTGNNHYDITRPTGTNCNNQVPTTPPSNCQNSWVLTANVNVPGGSVNAASTVAACQAACIASSTCQSIDFTAGASAGQQCWLGTAQTPKTTFNGNDHYDLTRAASNCVPTSGCSVWYVQAGGVVNVDPATNGLVVSNTIRQMTCFNSNPCVASSLSGFNSTANCISLSPYNQQGSFARFDWFKIMLQQQAGQAFPQRFVEDASFLSVQNALTPGYTSLLPVFTNTINSYYLSALPDTTIEPLPAASLVKSQASFVFSSLQPQPNVLTKATCANVWSRISEVAGIRNVFGGNVTKAICRQKCLVTPYCVGVSYDYINAMCYLETRPPNTPTVSLSLWPGYVYFELNQAFPASCTPGNTYTFAAPVSRSFVNVTTTVSTTNAFLCRRSCLNNMNCLGVNHQSGICTVVWPAGNVSATLANFQAFTLASLFGGPCCPSQVSIFGFNDPLAVLQSGVTTFDDCFTACSNALQCYAFDFYNSQCYFSQAPINALGGPNVTALAGALHIDLLQSDCGAGCRDKWDSYLETTSTSMTLASTVSSGTACRQLCQSTPTCTVINWNYQNNTCTWGTAASVRNFPGTSPGWRLYQLFRLAYCDEDYP